MFESDCSDDEINLSYKSVTGFTKKEDVPLKLWAEHFSKPEKDRNTLLTKIFEKERNFLKTLYCFLENDQVMGKTLTKFGIPNVCGKIDKKFFKLSSNRSCRVNKYKRKNKTYLSKPHVLSKKTYLKPSSSKGQDFVTPRYTPIIERWSDTALKKFKSVQKIPPTQTYIFDNDHLSEKLKPKDTAPTTTPTVDIIHAELANKTVSDTDDQKREESNENPSTRATVVNELKGLLKTIENKFGFKKCVRFNDDDLCSFAPSQEFVESLSRELSNSETTFDELTRDKSILILPDNSKTCGSVSDKTEQESSAETVTNALDNTSTISFLEISNLQETNALSNTSSIPSIEISNLQVINALGNTSTIQSLEISNLQESVGESQINPKRFFEKEKKSETGFEVEPYDNDNIVIEDFTDSYSDSKNEVELEKRILLNPEPGVNEATNESILNSIDIVKINEDRNKQSFVSNNLNVSEIIKSGIQEQKPDEEANKAHLKIANNKKIENCILNSKTKIKIEKSEKSLYSTQGKNIKVGKSVDSHYKTHSDISSAQINVNLKTKDDSFKLRGISVETSSQQQSISNELKGNDFNVSESKDIVVPETPSSDGTTDSKSCKSNVLRRDGCQFFVPNSIEESQISKATVISLTNNVVVVETPSSNESTVGSRSLKVDKMSHNVLESKVENNIQKESHILHTKSSGHLLVEDWSDDEFIPLSPSQPPNCNESSINITAINGSIISSDGVLNNTMFCMVKEENSLKSEHTLVDKHFENTSTSFGMLSPCDSLSGRDYVSNSSHCESEEQLPTKEKYESSNMNIGSENANDLKITKENEISEMNNVSEKENETILNDLHNEISFSMQTIRSSSNFCTPISELQTGKVEFKKQVETLFVANAPSKVEKNDYADSSTVDKSQASASQENENKGFNLMKHKSLNSLNPNQTLVSENKVRKILFPLQTQSSVSQIENEAEINSTKLLCMTTKTLNILNRNENEEIKNTENQVNQKSMEEKKKKGSCFSDMNLLNKGLKNSEIKNGESYESEKESFDYSPVSSKSGSGSPPNDSAVTENVIECDHEVNEGIQNENSNFISCTQTKNEDYFSICSSSQNEHKTHPSSHNEYALILLELSKEKENSARVNKCIVKANIFNDEYKSQDVLSNPVEASQEASSVDINPKNTYQDLNNKNLVSSEMDISVDNAGRTVLTNEMLSFLNGKAIIKSDNISVVAEKKPNCNWISPSSEHPKQISKNEISTNTQLKNDKASKMSDKQESALCSKSFNIDASKQLDVNLTEDCNETIKIKRGTSFITSKMPVKVHTVIEKSQETEYGSMGQMAQHDCNKKSPVTTTSVHSKAIHSSNQINVSVASNNSMKIKPQLSTKQYVTSRKISDINLKEDSTTVESMKISSKIKSEVFKTTKSIKINNKKEQKENSKMIFESTAQSEHEDCNAESSTSSVSSNIAHITSHAAESMTNITDNVKTVNYNIIKRPISSAIEPQLQTTQSITSSFKSSGINPTDSMSTENIKVPLKIKNETLVTTTFVRVNNKKEQKEDKDMIFKNTDCNEEAPILSSNLHSETNNIPSHAKEQAYTIDSVSDNIGIQIFTKRQKVASSQISSGINNQSTGDDTGIKNKKMLKIKTVTSTPISVNTQRKHCFSELSDFMVVTSQQQQSIDESIDIEKQNVSEMCFTSGKETCKATKFPLVPTTNNYYFKQLRNDDTGALSASENRSKTVNQSLMTTKRVEKKKNVDTTKIRLNENSPVNDLPKRNANLYSSNVILLSNEASLHNQSNLHKNQISDGKKDNLQIEKCHKSGQFTTNSIPVISSRNGQNYESIEYNVAKCQEPKSVPCQTKQLKRFQVFTSESTIKPQSHTQKLDSTIKKLNVAKNENRDSLRNYSSSENKTRSVLKTTNLLPINNWYSIEQQTESVHPRSIEKEIEKKSSGILLSTENLRVIRSSSHEQHQQWRIDKSDVSEGSNQISKKCNNLNVIDYKSLSTVNLLNSKQENSKEEAKRQSQMQQQHHKLSVEGHPQMRIEQNNQGRSEKHGESKELSNASNRKCLNKNVISLSSSTIKPLRFNQRNMKEAEVEYKSLIEDSPSNSDNESFYLEDSLRNLGKQLIMNDKDGFQSLLESDNESVQDFSGSTDCTNGNFSPLSSIGSDMLSNEILNNNSKSSNKQLKRRFLENLDNYSSDDLGSEASPTKLTRQSMCSPLIEVNHISMDGKIISSDDYVPSYHSEMSEQLNVENLSSNEELRFVSISPQYDYDMRVVDNPDSIKASDHTSTMITSSPIPSYSDGLNDDYVISSPSRLDDYEENHSPSPKSNCQSSDEDRSNYYLTDMFDD